MADEKQSEKPKAADKLELYRLKPLMTVALGNKKLIEWPSGRHPGATVQETKDHFVLTTGDGKYVSKVPLAQAIVSYRRVESKAK